MLAVQHRRRVMPQQPEGKFPLVLYLGLLAQIRQLVFQVLLFRGCHELQFYLPVAPVVHIVAALDMTLGAAVQQPLDAVVEHKLLLHIVVAHPLQWGRGVGWGPVQKRPFSGHYDCDSNNLRLRPGQQGRRQLQEPGDELRELDAHGIRRGLVFTDEASGRTMDRPGWRDLMSRVQPGDTVVVAFLVLQPH